MTEWIQQQFATPGSDGIYHYEIVVNRCPGLRYILLELRGCEQEADVYQVIESCHLRVGQTTIFDHTGEELSLMDGAQADMQINSTYFYSLDLSRWLKESDVGLYDSLKDNLTGAYMGLRLCDLSTPCYLSLKLKTDHVKPSLYLNLYESRLFLTKTKPFNITDQVYQNCLWWTRIDDVRDNDNGSSEYYVPSDTDGRLLAIAIKSHGFRPLLSFDITYEIPGKKQPHNVRINPQLSRIFYQTKQHQQLPHNVFIHEFPSTGPPLINVKVTPHWGILGGDTATKEPFLMLGMWSRTLVYQYGEAQFKGYIFT